MKTRTCREDIALANGRIVTHSPMDNGAQHADMADGGDMSETEWEEYCGILAKRSAAFVERQHELRKQERRAALDKIAARNFSV